MNAVDLTRQRVRLLDGGSEGTILVQNGADVHIMTDDGRVQPASLAQLQILDPSVVLAEPDRYLSTEQAASRLGISRSTLDGWVKQAPPELPGGPVAVDPNAKKISWRWNPETIDEWAQAFKLWRTRSGQQRRAPSKKTGNKRKSSPKGRSIFAQLKETGQAQG